MIKLMMMMTTMIKLVKNDLNLTFKLTVHSSRGFSKLLIQTLSAALVSRDRPIPGWQIQMSNDDDNDDDYGHSHCVYATCKLHVYQMF